MERFVWVISYSKINIILKHAVCNELHCVFLYLERLEVRGNNLVNKNQKNILTTRKSDGNIKPIQTEGYKNEE